MCCINNLSPKIEIFGGVVRRSNVMAKENVVAPSIGGDPPSLESTSSFPSLGEVDKSLSKREVEKVQLDLHAKEVEEKNAAAGVTENVNDAVMASKSGDAKATQNPAPLDNAAKQYKPVQVAGEQKFTTNSKPKLYTNAATAPRSSSLGVKAGNTRGSAVINLSPNQLPATAVMFNPIMGKKWADQIKRMVEYQEVFTEVFSLGMATSKSATSGPMVIIHVHLDEELRVHHSVATSMNDLHLLPASVRNDDKEHKEAYAKEVAAIRASQSENPATMKLVKRSQPEMTVYVFLTVSDDVPKDVAVSAINYCCNDARVMGGAPATYTHWGALFGAIGLKTPIVEVKGLGGTCRTLSITGQNALAVASSIVGSLCSVAKYNGGLKKLAIKSKAQEVKVIVQVPTRKIAGAGQVQLVELAKIFENEVGPLLGRLNPYPGSCVEGSVLFEATALLPRAKYPPSSLEHLRVVLCITPHFEEVGMFGSVTVVTVTGRQQFIDAQMAEMDNQPPARVPPHPIVPPSVLPEALPQTDDGFKLVPGKRKSSSPGGRHVKAALGGEDVPTIGAMAHSGNFYLPLARTVAGTNEGDMLDASHNAGADEGTNGTSVQHMPSSHSA